MNKRKKAISLAAAAPKASCTLHIRANGQRFSFDGPTFGMAIKNLLEVIGLVKTKGVISLEKDGKTSKEIWLSAFRIKRLMTNTTDLLVLEKRLNTLL